ncbi:MAG: PIN domain-containing protein [bacterium]|nr:PIN domain-containing protein [bacterium]MDZ4299775.1 PIN domain-containing protein [Candidatus Sungbacteria bacterium]
MEQTNESQTLLIDTNIFLEFLLKQERKDESVRLMQKVEQGKLKAYITSFSLHSIEVILDRQQHIRLLQQFLSRVLHAQGLAVYQTTAEEEQRVVMLMRKIGLDFDDALQYFVAKKLNARLISFDRDFDRTDVQRLNPSDVL